MSDFNSHDQVMAQIADEVHEATLVDEVKVELNDIDSSELGEHAIRFQRLHGKLHEALSSIDGL